MWKRPHFEQTVCAQTQVLRVTSSKQLWSPQEKGYLSFKTSNTWKPYTQHEATESDGQTDRQTKSDWKTIRCRRSLRACERSEAISRLGVMLATPNLRYIYICIHHQVDLAILGVAPALGPTAISPGPLVDIRSRDPSGDPGPDITK